MKILKRMTAALLALVMVVAMLPVSALAEEIVGDGVLDVPEAAEAEAVETTAPEVFVEDTAEVVAADDAPASGSCGENLTWTLVDGVLTISGTGEMTHYGNEDFTPWAQYGEEIHTIVIGSGVSNIPVLAFKYDHVADILADAESPFYSSADGVLFSKDKTILYSVPKGRTGTYTVPDGVLQIGDWAFSKCVNLASVEISEGVQTIGHSAFYSCTALRSVLLPESLIHIDGSAFTGTGIESLTIPKNVTTIANSFATSCFDLTAIQVAEGNKNYASIDGVLFSRDMTRLIQYPAGKKTDSYKIPKGVETICGDAMSFLEIKEVVIPQSVTEIGFAAFWRCAASDIFFQGDAPEIDDSAFNLVWANCHYPKNNDTWTADVRKEQYGHYGHLTWTAYDPQAEETETISGTCGENLTWTLVDGVLTISGTGEMYDYDFREIPWYEQREQITCVIIENGVTSISNRAFSDCAQLKNVTIPVGITSTGEATFFGCASLSSIAFPESLMHIGDSVFSGCYSLESVNLPDSLISIGVGAFARCNNLTTIEIPKNVTSIGSSAFSQCTGLTSITIPTKVEAIFPFTFNGCTELKCVTLAQGITSIGEGAFYRCTSLTDITIPNSVTSIGENAFYECTSLSSIQIPDSVTSIGASAFRLCYCLTDVTLPKGISRILPFTFGECLNLTSVTFPDSLTHIADHAFFYNSALSDVILPEGLIYIGECAFEGCWMTKLYIPDSVMYIGYYALSFWPERHLDTDIYYGGTEEQWGALDAKYICERTTVHFNSTMPGIGPAPSDGLVKDYLDNSTIRINGAGSAFAYYIGDPHQEYQFTVNGSTDTVTADASGVFRIGLGTFDTEGEQEVIVRITHIGAEVLAEPLDFAANVTVTPVEYTQSWEASLDASLGAKLMAGSEFEPFQLKASLGEVGGKVGGGTAMNISRSYSYGKESLELTSDKRIKAGFTVKCGITGNVLGAKLESGLSAGAEGSDTISYGLKIKDYSADNSAQQRAVATYLLGEVLFTCPGNLLVKSFYDHLAQSVYQSCGGVVIHGSASKITASSGAELAKVTVNDVEIASALESEIKASIVQAEKSGTDGNREKSMSASFNVNLSAVTPGKRAEGGEFGDNASLLSADFLGRDVKVAAKESNDEKILEATSLSAASAEYKIIEIGVPTKAVYNKYIFKEDAMDGLLSSTSHFDDYLNKNLFVLSLADLCELADVISASSTPVIYESEIKEKFVISLPLEFGVGLGLDTDLGVTLSYLTDTSYTNATGYAVDDQIFLTSESVDLSDVVKASDWDLVKIFTNCIKSLANDAANFFKKIGDSIQQGVEDAWGWIEGKADSVKDWFVSLTCVSTEEAWGESAEIGVLGSYVNFSLARQSVKPNEAYVTRSAMTIGRPFIVNVTDNATGEAIENFEGEPLEFTIRYAGEDLMAANYDAETQVISMYRYSDDGDYFEYIGGIHDAEANTVTAIITKPGQYILAAEVMEEEEPGEDTHEYQLGDVNHDGKINAKDATLILQKSVGVLKETAAFCEACAEVSGDGKLNAKDSTLILQFSVGLRQDFPGQK